MRAAVLLILLHCVFDGCSLISLPQFLIYGAYFAVIAVIFLIAGLCRLASRKHPEEEVLANVQAESNCPPNGEASDCT